MSSRLAPPAADVVYLDQNTAMTVRKLQGEAKQLMDGIDSAIRPVGNMDPDYRSLLATGAVLAKQLGTFQGILDGTNAKPDPNRVNLHNRILVPLGTTADPHNQMELANLMSSFTEQNDRDSELLQSVAKTGISRTDLNDQVQEYNTRVESLEKIIDEGIIQAKAEEGGGAAGATARVGGTVSAVDNAARGSHAEQKEYLAVAVQHFEIMAGRHQ
jgi:hypothetical protein